MFYLKFKKGSKALLSGILSEGVSDVFSAMLSAYRFGGFKEVKSKLLEYQGIAGVDNDKYRIIYQDKLRDAKDIKREYLSISKKDKIEPRAKIIAFYLPQYHPIKENDDWWGKGFTEWRNVTKAQPQYTGHYQPRLPYDLGFYDLRLKETLIEQVEIAKNYGIYGFCYHLYWFSGHRLLETPLDIFLKNDDIDFKFSICWANENWTRRWDGNEDDILIAQTHDFDIDKSFIVDMRKYLIDRRYIKINGKKPIVIYRPSIIPNIKELVEYWSEYCESDPLIGEVCFVMAKSFEQEDPKEFGFDLAVDFPPHQLADKITPINNNVEILNVKFKGAIYDYNDVVDVKVNDYNSKLNFGSIPTIFPSWDNEARKPGRGSIFHGATPAKYQEWLEEAIKINESNNSSDNVVFINAWNEWAEGAYLEPDAKYGYAYLEATYKSLIRAEAYYIAKETQSNFSKTSRNVVILHLHYINLFDDIYEKIRNVKDCDVCISLGVDITLEEIEKIKTKIPNVAIFVFQNKGRDIAPFFEVVNFISEKGFDYKNILKLHSKRSLHRVDGDEWRNKLINSLSGSAEIVMSNLEYLDHGCLLICPNGYLYDNETFIGSNKGKLQLLMGKDEMPNFYFPAGSMYWVDFKSACKMIEKYNEFNIPFESERGQVDGTSAHVFERYVGYFFTFFEGGKMMESKH